jgi:hypothetical protein
VVLRVVEPAIKAINHLQVMERNNRNRIMGKEQVAVHLSLHQNQQIPTRIATRLYQMETAVHRKVKGA